MQSIPTTEIPDTCLVGLVNPFDSSKLAAKLNLNLQKILLDIILPCFNPPKGWAEIVLRSFEELKQGLGHDVELKITLVNDGSFQGIGEEDVNFLKANLPALTFVNYSKNRGKGYALRQGVAAAEGDFVIYTDIDFPYTTESLLNVFSLLRSGKSDVVAGVRDENYYRHVPSPRRRISKILRWMLRVFLNLKVTDTQCGLKGFNAKGRQVFLSTRIDRFLFDLEFIFLSSNEKDLRLMPAHVELRPGITFSRARLGILARESLNFFWIFLRGMKRRLTA